MENPAQLSHVSKIYGRKTVFRDISLKLEAGRLTLIIGANGAGKSTLLRIIAGLCRPSSGEIILDEDARLAYLGHATFIYPALTALENLEFWARAHNMNADREHLLQILRRMGLASRAFERAASFSRGMAQRLNFARVLCLEPQVLLLDEPFTGLDRKSQILMREEIMALRQNGAAIALVSHALAQDRELADSVFALGRGSGSYRDASDFSGEDECLATRC